MFGFLHCNAIVDIYGPASALAKGADSLSPARNCRTASAPYTGGRTLNGHLHKQRRHTWDRALYSARGIAKMCRSSITLFAFCTVSATAGGPVPYVAQPLSPAAALPGSGSYTLTVNGSGFTAVADLNGDGNLDLIVTSGVASQCSNHISVWLGNPAGSFRAGSTYRTGIARLCRGRRFQRRRKAGPGISRPEQYLYLYSSWQRRRPLRTTDRFRGRPKSEAIAVGDFARPDRSDSSVPRGNQRCPLILRWKYRMDEMIIVSLFRE